MDMLYHASPLKNLTLIHSKRTISRDVYIGDFVFATSDKRLSAMYLATKGIEILLDVDSDAPTIVICDKPDNYLKHDKGGAIYVLPSDTFIKSPQLGLEKYELVSKTAVEPRGKVVYKYSLDAMKEVGVVIYFVGQKMFDNLVQAKNEKSFLKKPSPYK